MPERAARNGGGLELFRGGYAKCIASIWIGLDEGRDKRSVSVRFYSIDLRYSSYSLG